MNWTKTICSVCGLAFCGHVWHEAHQDADYVSRPLARKPMIDGRLYVRQPHGEEPDAPSGPLRMPRANLVGTSTFSATTSFVIFPLTRPPSS